MGTTGRIVVQKFGGTSVADASGRAALASCVAATIASQARPVVVVSAMGRAGAPYSTDTLLALLDGMTPDARERDLLASCGEVVSAVVVAHGLRAHGVPARAFTGAAAGILTDASHGDATVIAVDPAPLSAAVAAGLVPVVAGFQGTSADGEVTTLGRGGSDTTACAIGAALHADSVEIHTDVEGVMTADPRSCAEARVLSAVEFEELFQMARHGAKIVHAPAARIAMEAGVPVWVRDPRSSAPGTLVSRAEEISARRGASVATAVCDLDGVARISVALPSESAGAAYMDAQARVFRAMADAGLSLDMFTPCKNDLVFTVCEADMESAGGMLEALGFPYGIEPGLAKVTLVGGGMHGVPGVMARVVEALAAADVSILQSADSHTTISVLVCQNDRRAAVAALHEAFGLAEGGNDDA
ncbi:MAG: aspartate kinase [Coriobacteriia bacterium]